MRWRMIAAVALACGWSAGAQAQQTVEFNAGGKTIVATPPKNFCPPHGDAIAMAQMTASGDTRNATLLTLVMCGHDTLQQEDYFVVKAPVQVLTMDLERESTFDQIEAAVKTQPELVEDANEQGSKEASESTSRLAGSEAAVKTAIRFTGRDDQCVYLGGPLAANVGGKTINAEVGVCMTVVDHRLLSVYRFGLAGAKSRLETLQSDARDFAATMRGKAAP